MIVEGAIMNHDAMLEESLRFDVLERHCTGACSGVSDISHANAGLKPALARYRHMKGLAGAHIEILTPVPLKCFLLPY